MRVEIVTIRSTPAARARATMASSSSAKSGKSRWQWLSMTVMKPLGRIAGKPAPTFEKKCAVAAKGQGRRPALSPASAMRLCRSGRSLGDLMRAQPRDLRQAAAQQRPQVIMEGPGDVVARRIDEAILHHLRLGRDLLKRDQRIVNGVVADATDRHRAVRGPETGVLHRLLADLAGFAGVDVGDAAGERALQIAEGVAAH